MSELLDWLSRLLEILPVTGQLDLRCAYGAPWEVVYDPMQNGEMPYHIILAGSAMLETPSGGAPRRLVAGDILVFPHGGAHRLHDGGGAPAQPGRNRQALNLIVSENDGDGERLDMLCGRFVLNPRLSRLVRDYLPERLVVSTASHSVSPAPLATADQLVSLVSLMRAESAAEGLGGRAMLNALSTALFALALRLASETREAPAGLLALAGNPRLAPALTALFQQPAHPWTLPELAGLCNMSRATMARHFQETLGRSANDLLTDIRMTLAANALKDASRSVGDVADTVGYRSEAAFQRAFKDHMGVTPAEWRRTKASGGPSLQA
ncbi:MAG: AraC family transcriptional regulator [Caulobacteraceae bacterium]